MDYCVRLHGTAAALISGNTFSDYLGVAFFDSGGTLLQQHPVAHEQIGADNVVIDGNTTSLVHPVTTCLLGRTPMLSLMQVAALEMTCNTYPRKEADDT